MHRLMTALAVTLLFAAACGDDDGGLLADAIDASDDGGGLSDSGGDGDSSDDGGSGDDGGGGDGDGGGFGAGADSDFCQFNSDINSGIDGVDITGDAATLEEGIRGVVDDIDTAVGLAPSEIRDDVATLAEGFKSFADILEEYDWNIFSIPDDVADDPRLAALEDPAFDAAADRVNDFCGFDDPSLGDGDGGATTDGDGSTGLPDEQMRDLMITTLQQTFGWDEALATCVVDELGLDDPSAIDPSAFGDPTAEVCGQSIAELFG